MGAGSLVPVDVKMALLQTAKDDLTRTATLLEQVEGLQTHINAPYLDELAGLWGDHLVPMQRKHAADMAAVTDVRNRVTRMVEAHETIVSILSQKIVAWDGLLRQREKHDAST